MADALEWIARQWGITEIDHYLDDFITMGPPSSQVCKLNLDIMLQTCANLGVPLAVEKQAGPTTCLTFLGIEMDTLSGTLPLPEDKLSRLRQALQCWSKCKVCTRRDLESLIGHLQHACRVIRPGRFFLRRMIDLLRPHRRPPDLAGTAASCI